MAPILTSSTSRRKVGQTIGCCGLSQGASAAKFHEKVGEPGCRRAGWVAPEAGCGQNWPPHFASSVRPDAESDVQLVEFLAVEPVLRIIVRQLSQQPLRLAWLFLAQIDDPQKDLGERLEVMAIAGHQLELMHAPLLVALDAVEMHEPPDEERQAAVHVFGEAGGEVGVVKRGIEFEQALRVTVATFGG